MKNPKVGDRVAVYENYRQVGVIGAIDPFTRNLRIDGVHGRGGVSDVSSIGGKFAWFHPKQCRRLKPKRKAEVFVFEQIIGRAVSIKDNASLDDFEERNKGKKCKITIEVLNEK